METFYNTVDECIMAAYQHVKKTGSKIELVPLIIIQGMVYDVGFRSSDGYSFLLTIENNYKVQDKTLYNLILNNNVKLVDVINKQLLAFL